jgi:excisionase family DNA binding protein
MVCAWWLARLPVTWSIDHFLDKPPLGHETPRATLNEDAMSTQPWPVTPALSAHIESYVDCKRAAEFLSVDRKTIQRLSREGRIPAHPVLTGALKGRTTWRYKLSELDEWARTQQHSVPATRATSRREK